MDKRLLKRVAAYNGTYLDILAAHYGGDATINEIRVMNCILRAHASNKEPLGVAAISRHTGISKSTVSRAVLRLRQKGFVAETAAEADGRRRNLHLTAAILEKIGKSSERLGEFWIEFAAELAGRDVSAG